MYYYLTGSLKRRLILELQDIFVRHPVYAKIVPFIQNRFVFKERPQHGIVVLGSSSNKVALSGDNFMGIVQSHAMLAYLGPPKHPLEWVREDLSAIRANSGVFPSLPGIYFIEILSAPTNPGEYGYFAMDPLLTVFDEPVLRFQTGLEQEARLNYEPVAGTVRLWENERAPLYEDVDFTRNGQDIRFLRRFDGGTRVTGDYRRAGESVGPVPFKWNTAEFKTLPGVVLAFGKRAAAGDKVAVVITPDRVDAANAYGGKFETNFDLQVIARDPTQLEEITDFTIVSLWGERKNILEYEGIELLDVSMGGESEELYDETAQLFYYQSSVSVSMRADWEVHLPLPLTISHITQERPDGSDGLQGRSDSFFFATEPVLAGRTPDYERLG